MNFALSSQAQAFLESNHHKKIVFTNGCFDLLHAGHVSYLNEARALGDALFVGLNSDDSVKKLKGPRRPINGEKERKYILEHLRCVDFVEIFREETPYGLIAHVRPHCLVKGGDWKREDIIGGDIVEASGGLVKALEFKKGLSTTGLIERIQSLSI